MDIKVRAETGVLIDARRQLTNQRDTAPPTLSYWAKLFVREVNVVCPPAAEVHSTFHLREVRRRDRLTRWSAPGRPG